MIASLKLEEVHIHAYDNVFTTNAEFHGGIVFIFDNANWISNGITITLQVASGGYVNSASVSTAVIGNKLHAFFGKDNDTSTLTALTSGTYTANFWSSVEGTAMTHRFYIPNKNQLSTTYQGANFPAIKYLTGHGTGCIAEVILPTWASYFTTGDTWEVVDADTELINPPALDASSAGIGSNSPFFNIAPVTTITDNKWKVQRFNDTNTNGTLDDVWVYQDFGWEDLFDTTICSPSPPSQPTCTDPTATITSTAATQGMSDGIIQLSSITTNGTSNNLTITLLGINGNTYSSTTFVSNGFSYSITALQAGDYQVTMENDDGCSVMQNISIISNATVCDITITADGIQPYMTPQCSSVLLSVATNSNATGNSSTPYDVVWTDSSGNTVQSTSHTTSELVSYEALIAGDYTVQAYMTSHACSGTISASYTFTVVVPSNSSTITGIDESFPGSMDGSATVIGNGTSFLWDNGETTSTINNLSAGTYTCTVTYGNKKCTSNHSITIISGIKLPDPKESDVCLNLNTGKFEFTDNNNYKAGFTLPYTVAISINHSNGVNVYVGSLGSPDLFLDSENASTRTYDESNKLGMNFSIPIPMFSATDYIDDVYSITFDFNYSGTSVIDNSKTVYINATDLDLFNGINIDAKLLYSCNGDIESTDNTNYNVSSIPYTFNRTHELFPPSGVNLTSPVVSTGGQYISYDLYSGEWSNMITTDITWEIPSAPSTTVMYIGACVKRSFTGSATADVNCNIDPCIINQFMKNLKNRYDSAICDRDIININKYKAKFQRANELLTLYNLGDDSGCTSDYDELWDILGITNLDDVTSLSCCGDPRVNESMVADGSPYFASISCDDDGVSTNGGGSTSGGGGTNGGGGGNPPPPPPTPCPCSSTTSFWSEAAQFAGSYTPGERVWIQVIDANGLTVDLCFEMYLYPVGGFNTASSIGETPTDDGGAYWSFLPCGTGNNVVWGCTDSSALNHDPTAAIDDGTCSYCASGCTDVLASNFDSGAVCDDGSCSYVSSCSTGTPSFIQTNQPLGNYSPSGGDFAEDSNGGIWISGRDGSVGAYVTSLGFKKWNATLAVWEDPGITYNNVPPHSSYYYSSMVFDSNDNMYIQYGNIVYKLLGPVSAGQTFQDITDATYPPNNANPGKMSVDSSDNIYQCDLSQVTKYNGSTWSMVLEVGTTVTGLGLVNQICEQMLWIGTDLYMFIRIDAVGNRLAKYNGSAWSIIGGDTGLNKSGINKQTADLTKDSNGNIYVAGIIGGSSGYRLDVAKWDGSTWAPINSSNYLMPPGDTLYGGGGFTNKERVGLGITSTDVLVATYVDASRKLQVFNLDLNAGTLQWQYFTTTLPNAANLTLAAQNFVSSSDDIWIKGNVGARVKTWLLDPCVPAVLPPPPVTCVGTTSIPDVEFETRLEAMGHGNGTVDGVVDNICHVTELNLSNDDGLFNCTPGQILTLSGIEDFTDLKDLYAYFQPLTTVGGVNVNQNLALEKIDFQFTGFTSIDISDLSNLDYFLKDGLSGGCSAIPAASVNTLTSITLPTAGVLRHLSITYQPITNSSLINLNLQTSLKNLYLHDSTGLTTLDVSANTAIELLHVYDCSLTSLTLGNNINLFLLAGNTPNGTKRFKATGNPASLIIHVGNATGRVALAQSLFTVANGSFDAGTTIAI